MLTQEDAVHTSVCSHYDYRSSHTPTNLRDVHIFFPHPVVLSCILIRKLYLGQCKLFFSYIYLAVDRHLSLLGYIIRLLAAFEPSSRDSLLLWTGSPLCGPRSRYVIRSRRAVIRPSTPKWSWSWPTWCHRGHRRKERWKACNV